MPNRIEIKFDKTTLPKDGQKVKYRNLDTMEWKQGTYYEKDQCFHTNKNDFEFADMVDFWEPI